MNPQPPVTRMRIDALSSSGAESAREEIAASRPRSFEERLAQIDWAPWLILGLGVFLRFLLLSIKPPHFDEGINGWFVDQMTKTGYYNYDPTNYHGPLHFYVLFLFQTLLGRHIWALRLPVVLASIGSIWVCLKFEALVGRATSLFTALAMAISPGFIFYGRYAIHEVWQLLFSMLFVLGLAGLWKFGTRGYLWCVGVGVTGMILTKETYIIHIGCAFLAAIVLFVSHKINPLTSIRLARQSWGRRDALLILAVGVFCVVFFYSGTFLHWQGLKGLYQTFATWYQTGAKGNGHEKPWPYWLELTLRYEWPAVIGLVLCLSCQFFDNFVIRFLAIYGVGVLAAYSIVNYKTPWCIISVVWPFLFVFGAGVAATKIPAKAFFITAFALAGLILGYLVSYFVQSGVVHQVCHLAGYLMEGTKVTLAGSSTSPICGEIGERLYASMVVGALALGGVGYLCAAKIDLSQSLARAIQITLAVIALTFSLGMAIWLNYFRCSTDTEPYVYVQTYNDIFKLSPILKLAESDPTNYSMVGHMIRTSTYPIPWILGDFPNVGYYENGNLPSKFDADFLLVQEDKINLVEKKLHESYFTEPLTIRPYQDPSKLYLNAGKFRRFFRGQDPDFVGQPETKSSH